MPDRDCALQTAWLEASIMLDLSDSSYGNNEETSGLFPVNKFMTVQFPVRKNREHGGEHYPT